MGVAFEAFREKACCLCGSTESLTGEHKIKASALRAEFGTGSVVVGRFEDQAERPRLAQSVKSKVLHFDSWMCALCNNARTQPADREFDHFHVAARALLAQGQDPKLAFEDERYADRADPFLNLFRYFAKVLCCHLAELGAPRPVHMSRFARGEANENCVWLDVDQDWTYTENSEKIGSHQYAAHGGLVVYGDRRSGAPKAFHSTLTVGPLRYVFFSRLNWLERLELRLAYRPFYDWCRDRMREALDQPLSEADWLRLGLKRNSD